MPVGEKDKKVYRKRERGREGGAGLEGGRWDKVGLEHSNVTHYFRRPLCSFSGPH